jgi:biotin transport system ATP-binding protein
LADNFSPGAAPLISAKNVSVRFPGSGTGFITALDGINLDIHTGEFLLLAGSNGSGKTVLMRCMAGLLDFQGGTILHKGVPLENTLLAKTGTLLRRELGLVFQDADAQILGETVGEDVAFGPENLGIS